MEGAQPLFRLGIVPRRLFLSSMPSGHLEFSCYLTIPETPGDLPDNAALTWQLSEDPGGTYSVGGHRPMTADDAKRGRLYLATSLPPSWPKSRLQVELQLGDRHARGEWPVTHFMQHTTFRLPLDGQALVAVGHRIGEVHRLAWDIPSQQFAWDLVPLGDDGLRLLKGPLTGMLRAQDFTGFGAPVRAPAAGRVVRVADGAPDLEQAGDYPINLQDYLADLRRAEGNCVILDHGTGVWAFLAHLQCGSVCVQEQQEVAAGAVIGAVGNSGFSSGPHLHLHFMDGPDVLSAAPLPVALTAEGGTFAPQAGQILGP
ncbi:MAG TPA: M23 family metallopeptidase [Ktedonobacterales bacterium]|nr:M23 family metallopeptidase [Ktedonobacterales bacterium]